MKKKQFQRKSCKWIIEARFVSEKYDVENIRLRDWHRAPWGAINSGRLTYNVPSNKESRLMPAYDFEELMHEVTKERWSPFYEFRFKNIRTKETIPFALFPEIEYDEEW